MVNMVPEIGFEPMNEVLETSALPLSYSGDLAGAAGFEPAMSEGLRFPAYCAPVRVLAPRAQGFLSFWR